MVNKFDSQQFEQVDFSNKTETADKINNFVSEKTENFIKKIVSENDMNDLVNIFIINALCFIGEWQEKFDDPFIGKFYSSYSSAVKEIEMMSREGGLFWNLTKGVDWKCLGIPYKTRRSWLHIILPNKNDGLPELIKKMDYDFIEKCIKTKPICFVLATIPTFEIQYEIKLEENLKALGLTDLFFGGHGINKMFEKPHFVDSAIHKAGIKLDQYGTFGYSASAMSGKLEADFEYEPFIADHPFVYFVTLVDDGKPETLKSFLLMGTFW